jgi:hypothetical protein
VIKLPPLRKRAGKDLDEEDIREALLPVPAADKGKDLILNQRTGRGNPKGSRWISRECHFSENRGALRAFLGLGSVDIPLG